MLLLKVLLLLFVILIALPAELNGEQLGDSCATPLGRTGYCSYLSKCDKLLKLLMVRPVSTDNWQLLRASHCGWQQDKVLVCCDDMERVLVPVMPDIRADTLPQKKECGVQNMDRIVGGTLTGIGELPWVALLKYKNAANAVAFHCSATLITQQHVISAAHCIYSRDLYNIWTPVEVRLGEWDLSTSVDCIGDANDYECADPHDDIPIVQILPHENYVSNAKSYYHDIVLIRMEKPAKLTEFIRPICLPQSLHLRNLVTTNQRYIVAGWGKTDSNTRSARLKKVYLRGVDGEACAQRYRQQGIFISPSQLCAGGTNARDTCKGDSGSGLVAIDDSDLSNVHWYLAGVVSFGLTPCGTEGWPGVYTRITDYIDWIEAYLKK